MASKTLICFVSFLFIQVFIFIATGQNVKGGYWFRASEFPLESIDSSLFTHLFCAFADLNASTNRLIISQPNQDSFSRFTTTVQQRNPSVRTLLSIGGGSANRTAYSSMASRQSSRRTFINSSIRLARSYNFHGLDLDWEYPESASDMANLRQLLAEWRSAINNESTTTGRAPLLLTAAVYYSSNVNGLNYPFQSIARNLDWINLMAYDFYGPTWFNFTNAHAELYDPTNHISGSDGVAAWIQAGLPSNKLVLGIPFYGYAWRLVNPNVHGILAPAIGPVGSEDGSIGYNQIRDFIVQNDAATVFNTTLVADYCYAGTTWIGYDDTQSVTTKVSFVRSERLRGYFAWHVGVDYNWALSRAASQALGDTSSSLLKEV